MVLQKGGENNYCAPVAINKYGSCFTKELLIKLAKDLNSYGSENDMEILITNSEMESSYPKLKECVHRAYQQLIPNGCDGDHCYLLTDVYKDKNKRAFEDVFRPFVDKEWYNNFNSWLSTPHIKDAVEQYMNVHNDFKWYGASPQDIFHPGVCSAYDNVCDLNVKKLLNQGTHKIGIVFNLDDHTQSGSHWVGLFSNFDTGGVYYFDSTGRMPQDDSIKLMRQIFNQGNELILKGEHSIDKTHCINCRAQYLSDNQLRVPQKQERYFVPGGVVDINGHKFIIDDRENDIVFIGGNGQKGGNKNKKLHNNNYKLCSNLNQIGGKEGKKMNVSLPSFKCFYNQKDHQRKNTECGVYSINFIVDMLEGKSFYEASNNKVRDEQMWLNRFEKFFTPSSWEGHQEVMEAIKETRRTLKENDV